MTKVANHLHRYKKANLATEGKDYFVYRCMKPACNHYIPIIIAEGKLCECNRCGEPMIIGKVILQGSPKRAMARPHCPSCVKSRKDKTQDVAAIAAFLAKTETGT